MEHLKFETPDMVSGNIDKIATLFPSAITEMRGEDGEIKKGINFEVLKQLLSRDVVDGDECYEFTWVGKKAAMAEAARPITKTLRPVKEDSRDWDTTENLYIEGDNLEVLKILQESYLGKVKMIYIDPPYNTGHDFVYRDKFQRSQQEENEQMGIYDEDENQMFENTESNGRFHSDWCSMIYSRMLYARNFLSDDGIFLMSIDDNEQANAKKICDEIFGEHNIVCCFNWNTKKAAQGMTTANMVVSNHEYMLVYAKNIKKFRFRGLDRDEENGFSNPDNDPRGLWKRQYLQRLGQGLPTRTIVDPKNGNAFSFETPYTQEKLDRWVAEGRVIFPNNPSKYPARKEFLSEYENKQQLVTSLGLYATKATTEKLYSLFDGNKVFTNPKPDTLMKFIVQQSANDGIILDFFSGSATTAHAIMQLNAEDGSHRKFIMVQWPEPCAEGTEAANAGYKNICEIGKERIRRAGDKILEQCGVRSVERGVEGQTAMDNSTLQTPHSKLDVGFRVFRVDSSNMKDVYYHPDELEQQSLLELVSNIKDDRTDLDLLYACLLDWGVEIHLPHTSTDLDGCTIHDVDNGALMACFSANVPVSVVEHMANQQPLRAVFRDSAFPSDDAKINVTEIFKNLSPDTKVKVI